MSTPADDPTHITFTERGAAALDELAAALTAEVTAETPPSPEAIAAVVDVVVRADLEDLASAVTAVDAHSAAHRGAEAPWLADGELAVGRDANEIEWETVHAPMIHRGDVTPVGLVEGVEFHGGVRRVDLTIDGIPYSRSFDDRVDRVRTPPEHQSDPTVDPQFDLGPGKPSAVAPDEMARHRLARSTEPNNSAPTRRSPSR